MSNLIYPTSLARYGTLRLKPRYFTVIKQYSNRQEQRDRRWLTPPFGFEIDYDPMVKSAATWEELFNFWHRHAGNYESFYFGDWTTKGDGVPYSDLRKGEEIGLGNGARVLFKVFEDKAGRIDVYKNGVLQSEPGDVTVDLATGKITFAAAPAADAQITADVYQGLFRVRFDMDEDFFESERVRPADWRVQINLLQVGA